MSPFSSVAILGPGLLGGSLLHDAKRLGWNDVRAWTRRREVAQQIQSARLAGLATLDLAEAVRGADLIVLASPIGTYQQLIDQLKQSDLTPEVTITDVGSVKGPVVHGIGRQLSDAGIAFVGGHPMAGSEAKGLDAARPFLFQDAACLLTPVASTPAGALQKVTAFWHTLGARVTSIDPDLHDSIMARISHVPHLAAAAIVLAALSEDPSIAQFAAGGLRDTTRVASGDPAMWEEILRENRTAVLQTGRLLHQKLGDLLEFLENRDHQPLRAALEKAKHLRDARYPSPPK